MSYIHTIIAPKSAIFIIPVITAVLLVFLSIAIVGIVFNIKNAAISVGDGFLTVKAPLYGKKVPLGEVNAAGIMSLDLQSDANNDHKPALKTNGIRLPGCLVGWTKLRNGNKALACITDRTSVALIPTARFDILFSMDDVAGLKSAVAGAVGVQSE